MKYINAEKLKAEIERRIAKEELYLSADNRNNAERKIYIQRDKELLTIIASLQQEQPMPNSTQLIELWHKDKEMLKEKDFRDDPWRLAYNAFMCGFGRGIAVNKQKQPEVAFIFKPNMTVDEMKDSINGKHREQPDVDLENEIESYLDGFVETPTRTYFRDTIKHFYELGVNARKEEKKNGGVRK